MKKIIAFMMALMMTVTVMFNAYKASAVAVPVSYLYYLIQAVTEMLVGSGTCTQAQINDMNTSELFETAKGAAPSIDWEKNAQMKVNTINNINKFLNDAVKNHNKINASPSIPSADLLSEATTKVLVDFINGHIPDLPTYNPELLSFGAMCYTKDKLDNTKSWWYGEKGTISATGSASISGEKILSKVDFRGGGTITENEYSSAKSCYNGADRYEVRFVGSWYYEDGTLATDKISFVEEVPEKIGTVDIDGTSYDVNGDGTVTVNDKTIHINDDGTVTVDGTTYYPDYDVSPYDPSALADLITTIINNIDIVDDTNTDELVDEMELVIPQDIAESELSSFVLPKTILTVFPFCIPMDFYNGIKLLGQKPEAPRFEVPFEIPEYKSFPGFKKMIVVDFSEYYSAFAVVRWTMFTIFMFGLCFITFKIVKGI